MTNEQRHGPRQTIRTTTAPDPTPDSAPDPAPTPTSAPAPALPEPRGGPPPGRTALAALDALRARAFPARRERTADGESGPGFHVAPVWTSGPLWEADPADVAAAREECVAQLAALVAQAAARWGEPVVHDLAEALERGAMGLPVPAPLDVLSALVPRVYAWRDDTGRWLALGADQAGADRVGEGEAGADRAGEDQVGLEGYATGPCQVVAAVAAAPPGGKIPAP
ncbi:hypothetical protein [Streptomyces sp. NRRL F-4489]|uniref:hypothetical protein n=1 Tax=Streptomyces sp. NRRL F-4489 TaxID=1609095 RepID=UPI000833E0C1|nr:hypothetical protein [Streptomyces sp. NRRL F-4489]